MGGVGGDGERRRGIRVVRWGGGVGLGGDGERQRLGVRGPGAGDASPKEWGGVGVDGERRRGVPRRRRHLLRMMRGGVGGAPPTALPKGGPPSATGRGAAASAGAREVDAGRPPATERGGGTAATAARSPRVARRRGERRVHVISSNLPNIIVCKWSRIHPTRGDGDAQAA